MYKISLLYGAYVKKILSVILPLGFCILLFTHPVLAAEGCTAGLTLWYQAVLPSLLPFMIVSGLLIHTGLFHFLNSFYAPLFQRLFRISKEGCYAVLMGFLCGFPMGAKTTADLVRQGHLTREEGTYLLGFCNNVSPAFFMNYICMHALGYHQIPWKIVLLFYAPPVCYGILTRPFYHFPYDRNICTKKQAPMQRLTFPMLDACIMDSFATITRLGGYIILFSVCSRMLQLISASSAVRLPLESILEISCGIQAVCSFFSGASSVRLAAVCSCASFGGLCIFAQTKSVLCHAGIRIRSFTVGRLFLALLSFLLFLLLQKLSPVPVPGGY